MSYTSSVFVSDVGGEDASAWCCRVDVGRVAWTCHATEDAEVKTIV